MERPDEHDDAFAAWPFRRQLVDPLARPDDPLPPAVRPRVAQPPLMPPPRPRGRLRPLLLALPLAATAFLGSFALAAFASERQSTPQLVRVVDAAGRAQAAAEPTLTGTDPAALSCQVCRSGSQSIQK